MKKIAFLLIPLFLVSCSANWHLNKAIQKNPSILKEGVKIVSKKEVVQIDVPEKKASLKGRYVNLQELVLIDEETGIIKKILIDEGANTIEVETEVPKETVSKEIETESTIIKPRVVPRTGFWGWIRKIAWTVIWVVVGALLNHFWHRIGKLFP